MKKVIFVLSLALICWNGFAQHGHHGKAATGNGENQGNPAAFKDKQLGKAYEHYLQLKDALVASNKSEAQKASGDLIKALQPLKTGSALKKAEEVKFATTLEAQRKAFTALSNEMINLVKDNKLSSGEIYLVHCPMANGNTGGSWLSSLNEVRNPYYGDAMLKCGSIKETIK